MVINERMILNIGEQSLERVTFNFKAY